MNRILSDISIIGTFSIATSSTNLFLLRSDGNIGVNNTSPSARLHLKGSGTQSGFSFKVDNNSNNSLFHVRDDSNVGIGTSSTDNTRLYVRQISTSSTTWGVRSESTGNSILTGETFQGTVFAYSASASNGSQNVGYYATIKDNRTSNKVTANYGGLYIISGTAQNSRGLYLNVSEAQDYNYGVDSVIGGTYGSTHMNFSAQNSANMFGQKYGLNVQLSGSSNNSTGIEVSVSGATENYSIRTGYGISEFNYLNDINSDFKIRGSSENNLFFVDSSANSIGIRTQNPSYSLHVLGTVSTTEFRMTNGASSSYLMTSDSQGNASWTSSISLGFVTASGTLNYLPKWQSSNGLSSTSNVYDDGTVVMIGATDSSLWSDIGLSLAYFGKFAVYANPGSLETYGIVSTSVASGTLHVPGNNYAFYANPSGTARMYGFYANLTASNPGQQNKHGFYANVSGQGSTNYGYYSEVIGGSNNVGYYAIMSSTNSVSNIGVSVQMSSITGSNTGIYIDSSGSSQSYGIIVNKGTSIFNEFGDANTDFQIGGDTQTYLFFVDASTDNIGIRNATPSYALHLLGTVSTTGFRMTNGSATNSILRSNGTGDASWVTLSSLNIATGSGTTNYIPRWLSANNLSSTSSIYDNGSSVGIGSTTFTDEKLKIVDTIVSSSRGGLNIELSGNSTDKYGINIDIVGNYSSTNYNYGNRIDVAGSSQNYGIWGLVNGTYGTNYGMRLAVANGTNICYGIQNIITGTSQGKYAVYNSVSGINSQLGSHFGVLNEVSGSNLWNYGVKNVVSGTYGYRQASTNILGSDTQLILDIANMNYVNTDISKVGSVYAQYNANFASASTRYGTYTEINGGFNSISYGQYYEIKGTNSTSYGIYVNTYNATTNYGIVVNKGTSIFNQEGDPSTDFQIEGDTEQHLFFVDSSKNAIGVNNASPTYKIDVVGTVSTSDFRMTTSTTNYIPRWLSTSHISSTSSLYDDGIDVGIATTSVGRGRLSIVPRGASAAVYISNTTNNSYITYRANTATYSMGVDYDATNPYFAISGGPSSYTTGALGSFDRMRLYNDSMHLIINATSSTVGPASVSNIRKGELVISNFNSISSAHTGKAYTSVILVGGTTTTTISRELKTDGVTASSNKITIPTDTTSAFVVNIQGQSDSNPSTCYFATIRGLVQNYTSILTILGSTTSVVYNDMSGSASVSVDATSLQILAQTTTSQIARWVARVEMTTLTQIGEIP